MPKPLVNADSRPRIYFRIRDGLIQFAAHPAGLWTQTEDIADALDAVAGPGAWARPAVLIWEGTCNA